MAATAGTATGAATPAKGGGELEEIVVTAEKRESTVQATPIAMTALSAGDLSEQNIGSIQDLVGAIPGISLRTAGPGQTEYEMRGLASSGGSVATVGFYLDETPLSASAVALNGRTVIDADLFDLNRTEVLRGPQGTLYGAGSMGGTIKLVTNQPKLNTVEGGAEVDASYTSGASTNGRGSLMVNLPIGDIAAFRFVTTDKYVSGWITRRVIAPGDFPFPTNFGNCGVYYCTRGDVQDAPVEDDVKGSNLERFVSARGSLLIQPMDTLSITGNFMYQRIDADGYNVYQSPPGYGSGIGVYQPYDISEPYYDSFHLWSLKISYDMGFANLTSASSYWSRFVYQSQDSTEALQNIFNYTNFVAGRYVETDPTWQIAQEIRLTSRGEGDFQWVGGLYYSNLHSGYITYNQEVGYVTTPACPPSAANPIGGHCPAAEQFTYTPPLTLAPNPEGIMFNDNNPNILNQKAIFGEVSYKLRPDLKLTAGLRFYKFEISNEANQAGLGTASGDATPTIDSARGSNTSLLPKLNLSYEPNPDLTVYSTLSKGSRPGGVNLPIPLNPTGFYYCGGPAPGTIFAGGSGPSFLTSQPAYYAPDDIWSLEVGEKSRLDDRRFTVNADVFYVKWHNIQQLIVLSCGYPYNTNVGDAKTYGPEVELAAKVTDELTVDLSGAYTQAYISAPRALLGLSEEPSGVSGSPPVYPGQRINSIPKYTGDLAVIYETMLPQEYKFRFRAAESYVGPVQDTAYYRQTLGPYGLMDFRVGVGKEPWTASLFGTNLTNKHAALTIDNTVFAWQQPTITRVSTNQPRTVGLAFETKF
ncbi:MAG TPA: TonB-dependent receptor [Steroidobacteraceae bacterium]|nr:TonB-dependent receptor [Steroidobacteraceae bacterium]